MKTNDLKKGIRVLLRNGWEATMMDNLRGNTRMAEVYGLFTECGSVYAHDIMRYQDADGNWQDVEHTDKQKNAKQMVRNIFG